MLQRIVLFLMIAVLTNAAFLTPKTASAHFYVYRDPDFNIDITYPDDWKAQGGLPGDGRYKVMGPMGEEADQAQCILFAKHDRRYLMYPRDYIEDILAQEMQWSYWEQAVAKYDDLYFYYDNFGALNNGPARYTLVDYIDRSAEQAGLGKGLRKRAWVYGAIAGDLHVNVHCSSTLESFEKHADTFGQIIDSVTFPAPYATTYRGAYRDFLNRKQSSPLANTVGPILVYLMPHKGIGRLIHCPKDLEYPACLFKPKQRQIQIR